MLLGMVLLQSCTIYKGKSIALEDSYDRGKVKVHLVDGRKFKFKNLINKEGDTYGQIKQKIKDESGKKKPNYVKIYAEIKSIHLENKVLTIIPPVLVIAAVIVGAYFISYRSCCGFERMSIASM